MEGCFTFQPGGGGVGGRGRGLFFSGEGASFLSGGSPHGRASVLMEGSLPSHAPPTMGNPVQTCEKSHTTHQVGVRWRAMIIPFRAP